MAQEIQIFESPSFGEIRTAGTSEQPLFCLSDLCRVLELQVGNTKQRLDERGIYSINTPTKNQFGADVLQRLLFVNEKNLYKVIMRSDKPQAEPFQDWVCGEVLPSIRKTGTYSVQQQFQLPQTYLEALKALVASEEEKQQLTIENKVMRPKAEYFDKLIDRNLLTNIRDTAKQIHIPQNRFVKWLLDKRFVYRDAKRKLKPYAEYIPEYFELKDFERNGHADTQLLINPKGKETFRLMIAGE